jgi:DNA-binding CsgD family transcriptional regulator
MLSGRLKEVLKPLCDGKSEKEIAVKLNISPHTVHFHRMNLHAKAKSHNLAQLKKGTVKIPSPFFQSVKSGLFAGNDHALGVYYSTVGDDGINIDAGRQFV